MNAAMTEQMRNQLIAVDQPIRMTRPHIPTTPEAARAQFLREIVAMKVKEQKALTYLKQKAIDLAEGTNTASEAADTFARAMQASGETAITAFKNAELTQEEKDTFIKICKDGLQKGKGPAPGDREVYKQLIKNPDSLKSDATTHVQDDDTFEALTSPSKSKSDAAFERLNARFRMNPDIDPNDAVLTIANTWKTAERKGQVGSLVGKK